MSCLYSCGFNEEKKKSIRFSKPLFLPFRKRLKKIRNKVFNGKISLDPNRATKRPNAIIRRGTVVVHKDMAVAAIGKKGATEFSDILRRFHPTGCLLVEIPQFLQFSILFFLQKLNAHI